ncbi:MAG: ABC transporter ATP-binding protein [Coprococcus sp.]
MEQIIQVQNVSKSYGNKQILKNISFEAKKGRITAFLGPNGAGKSTTLRILLGLDSANDGYALIDGKPYSKWNNPLTKVGASFDSVGSPNDRTVYQHLCIIAISNGITKKRIAEVMEITGISHKASAVVGRLSLGECQRLGIAAALLGDPQFLIFDEPTNGLDPSGIRWFREFIKQQAAVGKTVLLSSHMLSEVEAVTNDVVIINHGRIVSKGTLGEIMNELSSLEDLFFSLTDGEE